MPGLNYATWSAALIPREGIVLGAINPAKYAWKMDTIAQKKPSKEPGRDARNFWSQRRGHCQVE